MKIKCSLAPSSIEAAIKQLVDYRDSLDRKAQEICKRLADMGAMYAEWNFSGVLYAGDIDYNISVDRVDANTYAIKANGETVCLWSLALALNTATDIRKPPSLAWGLVHIRTEKAIGTTLKAGGLARKVTGHIPTVMRPVCQCTMPQRTYAKRFLI